MNRHHPAVALRAGKRCEYCRAPEKAFNELFEVDHITPASRGGLPELANFALACRSCNGRKGKFEAGADSMTGGMVRLFHPRLDHWDEHFEVDADSGVFRGLTPVGRATIDRLSLNSAAQLGARAVWIAMKLFP